jgi:CBS domain-containing protein
VRERAVRRLPVIADGIPVGMVSVGDLALDQDEFNSSGRNRARLNSS